MKRTVLAFLVLVSLFATFSCKSNSGTNTPNNSQNPSVKYGTVFSKDVDCKIIFDDNLSEIVTELSERIYDKTGKMPTASSSQSPLGTNEIVIGNTSRKTSETAYTYLDRGESTSGLSVNYCIYAKNGSVAIAYDSEVALSYAFDVLFEKATDDGALILQDGVLTIESIELEKIANEKRTQVREAAYEKIKTEYTEDLALAIKKLYDFYQDDMYVWLANLWDPVTGGFYYSASARNSQGFLPDIESTSQAMALLELSGILSEYGNDYSKALPKDMKTAMLNFAISLQDPEDGFFYHPQWGKTVTTARKSRDLSWATDIITDLGGRPLYDTPNGIKGSLTSQGTSALHSRLKEGKVSAVSKIVSTSNAIIPEHLRTPNAIEEYILDLNFHANSYSAGNTLSTQRSQIKAAGDAVVEKMFEVLENLQFSHNGLWEQDVSYSASNGFMMVSALYKYFNRPIPHAEAALESILTVMKTPDGATFICSVYNPWASLERLVSNAKTFGSESSYMLLKDRLISEAADLIDVTREKLTPNLRSDGGFSYYHGYSSSVSQQAPVAIPKTDESDVNATSISITLLKCIFNALEIEMVPVFCAEDFDFFVETINNLGEIVKDEILPMEPVTFNDGMIPEQVVNTVRGTTDLFSFSVTDDPSPKNNDPEDKALMLQIISGSSKSSLTEISIPNIVAGGMCHVLDTDLYYDSTTAKSGMLTQIFFKGSKNVFSIQLDTYEENGKKNIKISELNESGTKGAIISGIPFGKWFNLRVEFYQDMGRAHIYLNDALIFETDVVWNGNQEIQIGSCAFLHYRNVDHKLYMDNIVFEKTSKNYSEYVAPEKEPDNFDDGTLSKELSNMVYSGCEDYISYDIVNDPSPRTSDDLALMVDVIAGASTSGKTIVSISNVQEGDNCYAFDTDLYYESANASSKMLTQIMFNAGKTVFSIQIDVYTVGSEKKLRITELGAEGAGKILAQDIDFGKWFNLRVEYYESEHLGQIYVDGKIVGETDLWWSQNAGLSIGSCYILHYRNISQRLYLDNIIFEKTEKTYVKFENSEEQNNAPADFDDGNVPAEIRNEIYDGCADYISYEIVNDPKASGVGDKALCVSANSTAPKSCRTYIDVFNSLEDSDGYVLEMDILFESTDQTNKMLTQIFLGGTENVVALQINVYTEEETKKLKVYELTSSGTGTVLFEDLKFDEWLNLRIEFTSGSSSASVSLNNDAPINAAIYEQSNASTEITSCFILYYRTVTQKLYLDNLILGKAVLSNN